MKNNNIKPLNNFVLLKVKMDNSKIKLEGGQILLLDTSYAREKHSNVVCEVVSVPDRLIYGFDSTETDRNGNKARKAMSMDWKTTMELRIGDEVIIHYLAYVNAFGDDKRAFTIDGEEYFFCPYEHIYLAKRRWSKSEEDVFWLKNMNVEPTETWKQENNIVFRDKEIYNVIMLNGYILVQPVEKQLTSKYLELPESLTKTNKKKVKVCFVGSRNEEYINGIYYDVDVKPGDIVVIDKACDVPLEAHETFNGKEEYWRIGGNLIFAKLEEEKEEAAV